ncbi:MAG: TonB-dependent receptor [Bryobacteraceae bacterium]|nr:TonB-dependent receptor [Bryobacteraceae bacterium]
MNRLVLLAILATVAVTAQIGTSTITGRVTDSSGAVVPGVAVTVLARSTNVTTNAVTNDEGIYRALSLQPGEYTVSFEASGFKKAVVEHVELRTGDTLAVDAAMQVGQMTDFIRVESQAPLLETETSSTRTVMSGNVLYELPLYQRYINSTLALVPGLTTAGYTYGGGLGGYNIAGQRSGTIGIFEDGVTGQDPQGGTNTIRPMQNAVAEVNVITTLPPAEYGHTAGGVISVVKKSGSNQLHGMASWYGRTRAMAHRRYFDQKRTSDPYPGKPDGLPAFFMQPDGNISGPVTIPGLYKGKDKTFFFFGYQRLHEKKYAQVFTTVPTPEMRQGIFTGLNPIYDPATTRQLADGTWTRDMFPNNVIPQSRIDPVARKVLSYDPWVQPTGPGTPTITGPVNNVLANEFARTFFNDYNIRMDHHFNSKFKINGGFTQNDLSGWGRPVRFREDQSPFDTETGNYSPVRANNSSVGYTYVISPSMVNDSRAGYFRRASSTRVPSFGQNWAQQLGIPNADAALMPAFGVYGMNGATPSRTVNETLSWRNDTTWIKGSHAFKFGYEILRSRLNSANFARFTQFNSGGVTSGLQPNGVGIPNTGVDFAGFLTGYVGSVNANAELTSWLPRSTIHSFYLQDDWKITPTLTMNVGMRYMNESPFNTKNSAMTNFDPTATDDLTGMKGAFIHPAGGLSRRDNNNFQPRLGLAWHPLEKWVFRGGLGFYTVDIRIPSNRGQFEEYTATTTQQALPGVPTPTTTLSRGPAPFAFTTRSNLTSPFVGTNFSSRGAEWWDPGLRNPYTMNWNASIQHEFTRNYLLEFSYQGSSGVGLVERWQANTFPIDFFAGNPTQQNAVRAAAQNYRPFPNFGDIRFRSNFGHSTFHAGTVKLEKRMSNGLYFSTFYTWSKSINSQDNDNDGGGVAPIQNRGLEKALAGYHRGHRFNLTGNYELPFGAGKPWATSGWKKWMFGGLEFSGVQSLESGNPLTISYTGSPFNYFPGFAGNSRPDVLNQMEIRDGWGDLGGDRFNKGNSRSIFTGDNNGLSNFALPGGCPSVIPAGFDRTRCDYRVGNLGRNTIIGTPLRWTVLSAQKNFTLKERTRMQLRVDLQNAFKTFNFNNPDTTVDFRNPQNFGKVTGDPTTASFGGQPLVNLTLMLQF